MAVGKFVCKDCASFQGNWTGPSRSISDPGGKSSNTATNPGKGTVHLAYTPSRLTELRGLLKVRGGGRGVRFGQDFLDRVSTPAHPTSRILFSCVCVCVSERECVDVETSYSTDMSSVRCLCSLIDWAYQSTHLHAHSHDGGPMRASDHCFRGTALMLMSASGSPKTKGACDGVDESQRQEHCIVDVCRDPGERLCKIAWRAVRRWWLEQTGFNAGHRDFGPSTRALH
ncbi:hypothetical protein LZ31DRAFT_206948 [Colletotrichum somersetense]|nr:hypothetical protein LZ31DRAFT_206948 [Colletotrichum somersetense]